MDARSSSLIVGLYVFAALAVALVVAAAFYWNEDRLRERFARQAAEAALRPGDRTAYLSRDAVTRQEYLAAQSAAEMERLRRTLDEKNRLLEDRTALLKQRTAAYQKLQRDFDAAAAVMLDVFDSTRAKSVSPPADEASVEGDAAQEAPDSATEPTPEGVSAEVAALREELNKARLLENTLSLEVEQLQAEVLAAETEIARMQNEIGAQVEQLLATERLLRETAGDTLVRVGEPAVPALLEALRDENPQVRRWAALVLADLGPLATSAVGPLMDALADRDETVRTAAAQALRAVGERE